MLVTGVSTGKAGGVTSEVSVLSERERAYSSVHQGAVYLHLGAQYLVRELDVVSRTIARNRSPRRNRRGRSSG